MPNIIFYISVLLFHDIFRVPNVRSSENAFIHLYSAHSASSIYSVYKKKTEPLENELVFF